MTEKNKPRYILLFVLGILVGFFVLTRLIGWFLVKSFDQSKFGGGGVEGRYQDLVS